MAFNNDQVVWMAGNLTKDPVFRTFPDGNEVAYFTLAINHQNNPTEFLDVQARGFNKEYIRTQGFAAGNFVIVGGKLAARKKTTGQEVPVLRVAVITKETSFNYRPLDWERLRNTASDEDAVQP